MCPGRKFAEMQLFLMFSNLLQQFKFEKPEEVEFYSEDGTMADVLLAPDFTVRVLKR